MFKVVLLFLFLFLTSPFIASVNAHVNVKPAEVGVGQRLNFIVSVPTEEDNPTTQVRLIIPQDLVDIRPNVKPGWKIEIKKAGESMKGEILNTGERAPGPETVTEIIWSGGIIPAEQRDEFIFSAQAPASETILKWLAYQTYSDGTVVAWDADPNVIKEHSNGSHSEENEPKPYSVTKVINDLASDDSQINQPTMVASKTDNNWPLILSSIAIILSGFSLGLNLRRNNSK